MAMEAENGPINECGYEIQYNLPNKGKGLFATKSYKEGDIIFEEKPLVCDQFLWNAKYKYVACELCMKSMETAEEMARRLTSTPSRVLPYPDSCEVDKAEYTQCPQCGVPYCSESCRSGAWSQYHETLCLGQSKEDFNHPLVRLQEVWRNMHYPPETCSIMLIAKMIALVKQAKDKDSVKASFANFCKATVNEEAEIAHKLLGQGFQDQLELLRATMTEALFEEDLQQWFTPEGFRSLFALIGTNGQGVGSSSISVWVKNAENQELSEEESNKLEETIDNLYEDMDNAVGPFLNCEGSALYALQSTINHSCLPNAEITYPYSNYVLAVQASSDLEPGDEICISYIDECCRERSRHSRQKALRENYLFHCDCPKCESQVDDPDVTSEEEAEMEDEEEDDMSS